MRIDARPSCGLGNKTFGDYSVQPNENEENIVDNIVVVLLVPSSESHRTFRHLKWQASAVAGLLAHSLVSLDDKWGLIFLGYPITLLYKSCNYCPVFPVRTSRRIRYNRRNKAVVPGQRDENPFGETCFEAGLKRGLEVIVCHYIEILSPVSQLVEYVIKLIRLIMLRSRKQRASRGSCRPQKGELQ